ncbi:MAG: 4Fe-4S binding protein, partial [Actinomycetota bacterium]
MGAHRLHDRVAAVPPAEPSRLCMSLMVRQDRCIGCGACDFSCHTDALTKMDSFLGIFEIDPYTCDDCMVCVGKCPENA